MDIYLWFHNKGSIPLELASQYKKISKNLKKKKDIKVDKYLHDSI